uniref:Cytochrome P450 n=1 Tax=Leersia perrieri TaxID=77586 RepID=A0A0D9WMT6_9ORYZ
MAIMASASTGQAVPVAVAVAVAAVVVVSTWLWKTVARLVWRPYVVAAAFRKQGITGPAYRLYVGSDGEANAMRAAGRGETLDARCHDIVPRFIPTKTNVRRWELEKKVRGTLMAMIRERQADAKEGGARDLLGLMLEANDGGGATRLTMDEIVDECKTFFFAGHESTAHLLTWSIFLLGTKPQWQDRLRDEVLRECAGDSLPDADSLSKLKLMTMVIYETLRLYGAVSQMARMVTADTELAGVRIPKGTMTLIPVAILHREVEVWGEDAGEFNPLRFRDGVNKAAAHAGALLAFSLGQRSCIGQDFAMLEAKATLAMILRRFTFEVSPEYVHAPLDFITLQPQCGLPVVLKLLN